MNKEILAKLRKISDEEKKFIEENHEVCKELYTSKKEFIIDSDKLLEKGKLIQVRPNTRFYHFPKHSHNYVEMVYMCHGKTTHIVNGTDKIVLEEGDILLLNQNSSHEVYPPGIDDIAVNFIILPQFFDRPFSMIDNENIIRDFMLSVIEEGDANYLYFRAKDILPVQNLMENMIWSLLCKKQGMNTINQTTMGLIFMNLLKFTEKIDKKSGNQSEQNIVFSVMKYIENYYRDGTLSYVALELGQPVYYISRLLKKHTGHNFKELLQQKKMQQAAYLLKETTLTVDSIIKSIGYENSSYFYRQFKAKYGCSPAKYRGEGLKGVEK